MSEFDVACLMAEGGTKVERKAMVDSIEVEVGATMA